MAIKTSMSMSGFVTGDPQLTQGEDGIPRCYMRVGQEHYTRNLDGSFTQDPSTFHDLVIFRATAEKAVTQFKKGDRFVAEGYTHTWDAVNDDGVKVQREEFVARKIGHDTLHTRYQVDRTPRVQQGPSNGCAVAPVPTACDDLAAGLV